MANKAIVLPEQFKEAFLKVITAKDAEIVSIWRGPLSPFTKKMRELLPDIASHLGLNIYNDEYYTLDAVFYEEKDTMHFSADYTFAKYIAVALEHENRLMGTEIEINKLQLFNAPLKVLITYAEEDQKKKYLDIYSRIISEADVFGDISTHKKQLVIFGQCDGTRSEWSFHVYQDGRFVAI